MQEEKLSLLFRRIALAAKKDTDNALKKWDLTMSQAMVLEFLNNTTEENRTQKAVEQHFGLQHPTVSGILKRLEKSGFIRTATSETDRRAKTIFMTEKAWQADARAKAHQDEREAQMFDGMTKEELKTLRRLLLHILDNIKKMEGQ
jgi:MarR family multiple gene transcriptional regulator MgrA